MCGKGSKQINADMTHCWGIQRACDGRKEEAERERAKKKRRRGRERVGREREVHRVVFLYLIFIEYFKPYFFNFSLSSGE